MADRDSLAPVSAAGPARPPVAGTFDPMNRVLAAAAAAIACTAGCSFNGASRPVDGAVIDAAVDAALDAQKPDGAPGAGRKKRIAIDPARVVGSHTSFPVWIRLDDPQLAARARTDGTDLYFTRLDGTPLEWERQRWDQPTGHLEAWVRLDLDASAAPTFELRYGDPGPAHAPNAAATFTSGFAAVWHLESAGPIPDATGAHPGTPVGLAAAHSIAGTLGRSIRFDGSDREIQFTNPLTGNGPHTISLWVDQDNTADNDALVVLGNPQCGESRWFHSRFNNPTLAVGFFCNDWTDANVDVIDDGWTHLHWVFDGTQSTLYRDGVVAAGPFTQTGTPIDTAGTGGHLGFAPAGWGGNMGAHAALDEVRIATVPRSAAYITTEHNNQSAPQTFYSVGTEEQVP
jgi:hypothetical protein